MIKFFAALSALLFINAANAQTWGERTETFKDMWANGSDTARVLLGSQAGNGHWGVDYEHRMGVVGLGAFYIHGDNGVQVTRDEFHTLGFVTPVHLIDRSVFDIYVAPGLNVTQVVDAGSAASAAAALGGTDFDDVTTWGATMKFGMMYYCNKYWSWGLDFVRVHNVSSKKAVDQFDLVNFGIGYTW